MHFQHKKLQLALALALLSAANAFVCINEVSFILVDFRKCLEQHFQLHLVNIYLDCCHLENINPLFFRELLRSCELS
jgi:hypothetical protein